MARERIVGGYVRAYKKHQTLAAKYQAKLDALRPLKSKVDQALIQVKIRHQKMTGGDLSKAQRIILEGHDVLAGNRHED